MKQMIFVFAFMLIAYCSCDIIREWCWKDNVHFQKKGTGNVIATLWLDAGVDADLSRKCIAECYKRRNCKQISYNHQALQLSHECILYSSAGGRFDQEWKTIQCPYCPVC